MAYLVKQIPTIVNDAVADALGKNSGVTNIDTNDFVSLGKAVEDYDLYEGFFSSLVNRLAKTVYFVRSYKGRTRSVLMDETEFGAFIQKVYYDLPDASDNPTWDIPNSSETYAQASPYDVEGTVSVSAKVFGGQGTWSIEVVRPMVQIRTAFNSLAEMNAFIDGIYIAIENSYNLEAERLTANAVNTAIANSIHGSKARNLLAEYNTLTEGTLTSAKALTDAGFLKFASMEISKTITNMTSMSTLFNTENYPTFTDKDNLVVEMLTHFSKASAMYLQADTFHDELVALPKYEEIPYWQSSGTSFAFDDCSKISITNKAFANVSDNTTGKIEQGGIICFLHDVENVGAYFGSRRTWEMPNPRQEIMIHGEKAEKGFAVDGHANAYVFYIAD